MPNSIGQAQHTIGMFFPKRGRGNGEEKTKGDFVWARDVIRRLGGPPVKGFSLQV